jgi:neutral ceramidase
MMTSAGFNRREFLKSTGKAGLGLAALSGSEPGGSARQAEAVPPPVPTVGATSLKAGVAKVDITPPAGLPMWGYDLRVNAGTLDPLYARVLLLESGQKSVAIVALDLGRCFGKASTSLLRSQVRQSCGTEYVLLAASHTHSGPVIQDTYKDGTPAWETSALEKIASAIEAAHTRAMDARLGTGYGVAYIGHNRHQLNPDGRVTWFEHNPTHLPTAPIDPTVAVLRVDTLQGEPLAILVNYACHAVVFGPDNRQYSADYPGVMTRVVEEEFGNKPLCFFLQGAAGDINAYYSVVPLAAGAKKLRDWTGNRLGQEAAQVARSIQTKTAAGPSIVYAETSPQFHFRWNPEKFRQACLGSAHNDLKILDAYYPSTEPEQQLPVGTVLINREIAFMSMPGEPFVEFQMEWRERCPVRDCFFLGYANGYYGYLPTVRAATEGGYGAASTSTWMEVGAGDRMVDTAVVKTYEMLGRLHDGPEDPSEDYTVTRPLQLSAVSSDPAAR